MNVIDWLLDSDPAIRWQTMRDLLDLPDEAWKAERAKVETEGWGAELLSHQDEDGQWAGGAFFPAGFTREQWMQEGQPWTATHWALGQLRELGLDPASERAQRTVALIGENSKWDHDGQPFWEGEVEECINGRTVADGAYFGVDVSPIVDRLVTERLDDGGWNCERAEGSTRSSYHSTINVLEGLLGFERATGGSDEVTEARRTGEEFLLERSLFRRLGDSQPADDLFLQFHHPSRSRYDVLRALDYFRAADSADPRMAEAVEVVRSRRLEDGTWPLDRTERGRTWLTMEEVGGPSRWVALRSLRVLRWWDS